MCCVREIKWVWVSKFDQWPAKAVVLADVLLGSPCPLWETKREKLIRCPTVTVTLLTKPSSCSSAAGCHGLCPALWFCVVGAGGCPDFFKSPAVPGMWL